MTLVDRLRAAIEATKTAAEEASPGPWSANAEGDEVVAADGITVCDGFALSGRQLRATVDHIVRHDPTKTTRRCETDLALLDEHARVWLENQWVEGVGGRHLGSVQVCRTCEPPKQLLGPAWPCRTIVLLAEGYGITEEET